jgi:putative transposase
LSLPAKRAAIEVDHCGISIARQCQLLGLSRSSFYYQAIAPEDKQAMMNLIDEHYCLHPTEGARKVSLMLKSHGYSLGRHATQHLMQEMGVEPIYPKPNTSVPNKAHTLYPYLLRDMDIVAPNQVWAADITYCRLKQGFAYLVAIMDWHSRYVIEWELSSTLDTDFCVTALKRTLQKGRCEIFNTDQGSQFTSSFWIDELTKHHITISMDGKGRYLDNIFVERLWRSVKCECIYIHDFQSIKQMRQGLETYFQYYNFKRPHQGLDYLTPAEVYFKSSVINH